MHVESLKTLKSFLCLNIHFLDGMVSEAPQLSSSPTTASAFLHACALTPLGAICGLGCQAGFGESPTRWTGITSNHRESDVSTATVDQCTAGAGNQLMGTAAGVVHWIQHCAEPHVILHCFKDQQAAVEDDLECPRIEAGKCEGHESKLL